MSGYTTCPACKGDGVVVIGIDYCCGNKAITDSCTVCRGTGEVRADVAMAYLEQEVTP